MEESWDSRADSWEERKEEWVWTEESWRSVSVASCGPLVSVDGRWEGTYALFEAKNVFEVTDTLDGSLAALCTECEVELGGWRGKERTPVAARSSSCNRPFACSTAHSDQLRALSSALWLPRDPPPPPDPPPPALPPQHALLPAAQAI